MRSLQLRHSQTPESAQMARAASALDLPLHANLGIMAQRRRRLLRQAHKSAPQTRRVSIRRRDQCRPQTLRVDRTPKPHPRRCQKREGKVRVDPLAIAGRRRADLRLTGEQIDNVKIGLAEADRQEFASDDEMRETWKKIGL